MAENLTGLIKALSESVSATNNETRWLAVDRVIDELEGLGATESDLIPILGAKDA